MLKKQAFFSKIFFLFALIFFTIFFNQLVFAQSEVRGFLPSSIEPGQVGKTLSDQPITAPQEPGERVSAPKEQEAPSAFGEQAKQIKFHLNKIILEGNTVYSDQKLEAIYKDKLNKTITVAELEGIVQSITNYYRNSGYILSRAILPPQHVANGVVRVRVIEGYISQVAIQGKPRRAYCLLKCYGENISKEKPVKIDTIEHWMRLANEVPGVSTKAVLEPSKTETGASDLNLVTETQPFNASLSYDNYGTRYIGPNQVTGSVSGNSMFRSGDSTHFTTVRTARPLELNYLSLTHETPIGCKGWRFTGGANNSLTRPGFTLRPLKLEGDAANFFALFQYPWIRSRSSDLTVDGGFNYIDSGVNLFGETLYFDHLRTIKGGGNYNFADRYAGTNLFDVHLEHGFKNFLGASSNPYSPSNSRFGADGHYTKWNANAGRLQRLFWKLSAFFYATGQYSYNPLLASAQFAYGGSQLGRAYDPAEIIGDRGAAGSVELRMDNSPGWRFLQALQPYAFYDAGVIWNIKNVAGIKQKQSATSTGVGIRFFFMKNLSGTLMIAQPLTKQISAEEIVGYGRRPRGYFSIIASV